MQEMIGLVLNIFLQMNELESLDFQLNQIERLLVVYPALNAMVTHFQKVLPPSLLARTRHRTRVDHSA
jgi:hypothetical protein